MAKQKPMGLVEWNRFIEAMQEYALRSTFEARVGQLEAICRNIPGICPNRDPGVPPEPESREWYAEAILFAIRAARHFIERGDAAWASAEALSIGALATEAARLNWPEIRGWRELVDNESKEGALVGTVIQAISFSGQIYHPCRDKRFALDMEIEFKGNDGIPTGKKVCLQLKSGDSHLRPRKRDGREVFNIPHEDHARYWMEYPCPVFLVVANSKGAVRWMEVRDYLLSAKRKNGRLPKSIVFDGKRFSQDSILEWRRRVLGREVTSS